MIGAWLALAGWLSTPVLLQESGGDSSAVVADASSQPFSRPVLEPYADLRSWIERVENRPGASEDLKRSRATLRAGLRWRPASSPAEIAAGFRASLGSDRNAEARAAFDNETPDTIEVDELMARVRSMPGDAVAIGKMRSSLALTEMIWDADLRPVGATAALALERLGVPGARLAGGWLQRADWSDDAWMAAGQAMLTRDFAERSQGEMVASYAEFHHLDELPSQGFARQNTIVVTPEGRRYAVGFRVLDLQAAASARLGAVPIAVRVELARNLAASEHRDGVRTRLALGGVETPGGWEVGWLYQRIERDAVCGAFNSDDWWFHSRSRGHLGWVMWGQGRPVGLRFTGTIEQRDDLTTEVHRLRAELLARLPSR